MPAQRKRSEKLLSDAIRKICKLMREHGVSQENSLKSLRTIVLSSYAFNNSENVESIRISRLADVCTRWYFERDFVDSRGQPKPLRWNGRSGTLLNLVKRVVGAQHSREVISDLLSKRLVKKTTTGAWLPKSRVVAPAGFVDAQVHRSCLMLDRLLRTIAYNSERRYKGDVLLEVMAQVPRLPRAEIKRFKLFAKAQGLIFAKAVDDWLESRSVRRLGRNRKATNEVGVVAFAFVE